MPNGKNVLHDLDFEKKIGALPDRQLLEFVARHMYEQSNRCITHENRLTILESGDRKRSGVTGGIAGTIASIIIGIIAYFRSNG